MDAISVVEVARRFLDRWSDGFTRENRDDLVQETALTTWIRAPTLRDPDKLAAFVRTIARRVRGHALRRAMRERMAVLGTLGDGFDVAAPEPEPSPLLCVGGDEVPTSDLLEALPAVAEELGGLNRHLLLSYHEGFSCAELAERFALGEEAVKVRLHRCRRRLRQEFEKRQRAAR